MLKFLMDVVAGFGFGQNNLPYNIGEPYSSAWGSWTHSRGTSKYLMGNCKSCYSYVEPQSTATIIDAHGNLVKIKVPITATEIMLDEPRHVVSLVQLIKY
ncbi:hypothetical protein RHGRI_008169 [Rhododendron griersonianum]|uniref:Uncharacterized protein n=1 Tax=Rhododendron griersonianum TaxID=479676 RepID=A0AAV6KZV6_9ERIC|nr:hypothetical protein RHGRI_008169 [Rhododendron griersonianum]